MSLPVCHTAPGGNNDCDSTRDWDDTDKCVYHKVMARVTDTPKHHLDLVYALQIPAVFKEFQDPAIEFTYKTIGTSPEIKVQKIVDSAGVEITAGLPTAPLSATKATFSISKAAMDEGSYTYTPDTLIYIHVRISTNQGDLDNPFTSETGLVGNAKANFRSV